MIKAILFITVWSAYPNTTPVVSHVEFPSIESCEEVKKNLKEIWIEDSVMRNMDHSIQCVPYKSKE